MESAKADTQKQMTSQEDVFNSKIQQLQAEHKQQMSGAQQVLYSLTQHSRRSGVQW